MAYMDLEEARLREENARLKGELTYLEGVLHRKNIKLDALHYVWCSGGCETGVHRFDGEGPEGITREIVEEAIRNTDRLIEWFGKAEFKRQWKSLDVDVQERIKRHQGENAMENSRLREALENIVRYAADCCPNRGSELTRIAWHAMGALRRYGGGGTG